MSDETKTKKSFYSKMLATGWRSWLTNEFTKMDYRITHFSRVSHMEARSRMKFRTKITHARYRIWRKCRRKLVHTQGALPDWGWRWYIPIHIHRDRLTWLREKAKVHTTIRRDPSAIHLKYTENKVPSEFSFILRNITIPSEYRTNHEASSKIS
jgi:hypothetical protein